MNEVRRQNVQTANEAYLIERLDNWLTSHNFAESFLIITNFLLLLKSSSNLLALFNDSQGLIIDYNGSTLFSDGFRWCFLLVNMGIASGSILCLVALLFSTGPEFRLTLLKCFVAVQLTLAFITLLLMGRLWFAPFKLELDSRAWEWTIRRYNYQFEQDTNGQLCPSSLYLRVLAHPARPQTGFASDYAAYDYRDKVDKLQLALSCCGVWGPSEWRRNELLGLLAPSCCASPIRVDVPIPVVNATIMTKQGVEPVLDVKQIYYCHGDQKEGLGCQQQLNDRDTRFLFRIRLQLLLLIGILVLNVMSKALLKFEPVVDPALMLGLEPSLVTQHPPPIMPPTYDQSRELNHNQGNLKQSPPSYQLESNSARSVAIGPGVATTSGGRQNEATRGRACSVVAMNQDDLRMIENIRWQTRGQGAGSVDSRECNDTIVLTIL